MTFEDGLRHGVRAILAYRQRSALTMLGITIGIASVILLTSIGEGARVYMLDNAWYTVISPEGCAAILWRDSGRAPDAAEALKPTAPDLMAQGIIDGTIAEPGGGAHRDWDRQAELIADRVEASLAELETLSTAELLRNRLLKYRGIGAYTERADS